MRGVARGEVAHDRVRLVEDEARVVDHRDEAVGIHRKVFGRVVAAEGTSHVEALVGQAELLGAPHDLLHVDRRDPAPDLQHYLPGGPGRIGGSLAGSITTGFPDCLWET